VALRRFRPGPIGIAITLYDVWRRLPPRQRQQVLRLARKHGPVAASKIVQMRRRPKR
jgi:hypothetical protein